MRKVFLFSSDIAALYGSLALMVFARYGDEFQFQFATHVPSFTIVFALWIIVFYIFGLYEPQLLRNNVNFYSSILRAVAVASALSVLFFYLLPIEGITPKTNLAIFIVLFLIVGTVARSIFNELIETRFQKSIMIVGLNPQSIELAGFIKHNPQLGYYIAALADIGAGTTRQDRIIGFSVVRGPERIAAAIRAGNISTIVVSPETYEVQTIIDIFYRSLEQQVNFYNLASFYERLTGKVPLGVINQVWFLENITEGSRRLYELGKRVIDVVLACLLGVVTLLALPLVALAIKLDSPGPVFYRQRRLGRAGKIFELVKFRTMISNDAQGGAEGATGAVWTQQNDPRITRVGRLLRKTRIDELPQLWNILMGEMSFVGPRSERPEFHQILTKEVPFYQERYLIKPGATGWAQLQKSYYSSVEDTMEKLQYDLYYIKNRSVILDIGILLRTISLVLRGFGR